MTFISLPIKCDTCTPKGYFVGLSEATYRAPAECLLLSLSSFSAKKCCFLMFPLQQPSPTTLGKPAQVPPLRQVCPQANVTPNTRIVCYVNFGSCAPWWLKILATIQRPRSSRTFFGKAQLEVRPGAFWVGFSSRELRAIAGFMGM